MAKQCKSAKKHLQASITNNVPLIIKVREIIIFLGGAGGKTWNGAF
jgi:hypothetical protein